MKVGKLVVVGALLAGLLLPTSLRAQDSDVPEIAGESRFGVGFQSSFPVWGVSGLYDMSPTVTLQGIVGAFGRINAFGARGLYRFERSEAWDAYGYGTAGLWTCSLCDGTPGFGGGAGIELKWPELVEDDFPPIYSTFDIGVVVADVGVPFSGFVFGTGLHYRF